MRFAFGEFVLDTDARELCRGTEPVRLSPKALHLLEVLVDARPRALGKDDLMRALWPETFVVEANLSNLIGELRGALGESSRHPRFLRTVSRFGYAFVEPIASHRRSGRTWLVTWSDGRIELAEGTHVIGRGDGDVRLAARSVSRAHARVTVSADRLTYEDLGSKNGSFRDRQRLRGVVDVDNGDAIMAGTVTLTFHRLRDDSTDTVEQSARLARSR
jgi:DNA-binding winged helix-turn-helix (wHTH) protein